MTEQDPELGPALPLLVFVIWLSYYYILIFMYALLFPHLTPLDRQAYVGIFLYFAITRAFTVQKASVVWGQNYVLNLDGELNS